MRSVPGFVFQYPRHLVRVLAVGLIVSFALLTLSCSDDSDDSNAPDLDDSSRTGNELVERYMSLLRDQDVEGLRDFLSDAFIVQRADGSHSEKAAYLENVLEVNEYTITDVTGLQADDVLIVRWTVSVDEVIEGRSYSGDPAPRLSTFAYEDGDWRLTSHANFNAPASAGGN